jgi:hypothetical protein
VWDYYRPLLTQITYTHVSLSRLLRHFQHEDVQLRSPRLALLSPNEQRVLEIIASGEYQKVTIKFKDKKMKAIEMTRQQEDRGRILDILNEGNYHEITIRNREGMQTVIENTEKINLD